MAGENGGQTVGINRGQYLSQNKKGLSQVYHKQSNNGT